MKTTRSHDDNGPHRYLMAISSINFTNERSISDLCRFILPGMLSDLFAFTTYMWGRTLFYRVRLHISIVFNFKIMNGIRKRKVDFTLRVLYSVSKSK